MIASGSKVTRGHLRRDAYLYVRQSSLRQVMENTESTRRQYALRERATALGWPAERVIVIDDDLGQSAAGSDDRAGFQRLVGEVGVGKAGIVLGLEVSRLARSSADWHRLLEICALTDTLILDEDGVYDPAHFNDRLLLGLKGTMSEAELHVLRARLRGGVLNKARRGELQMMLPAGLVYDDTGRVVRDPDRSVQEAFALFFETFRRAGSATATVRHFRLEGILFPMRLCSGPRKGEVTFGPLHHSRALRILRNPRYAGAFAFGRTQTRPKPGGGVSHKKLPRDQWTVLIPDAHEGYITWEQYESNLRRLRENAQAVGADRRTSPPREGPALPQGIVICGRCGDRMSVRYTLSRGIHVPVYACQREAVENARQVCQLIPGGVLDAAVGELLVQAVTPLSLEVAMAVAEELHRRTEEVDRLRRANIERARYEADLAERRYRRVDPDNRLVADALEADWNQRLRDLTEAIENYERQRKSDAGLLDSSKRAEIMALAQSFPLVWNDPRTPHREKKRMVRLMIEDVTLVKGETITAHIRFRGGATRTLFVPRAPTAAELRRTEGFHSGTGQSFKLSLVTRIRMRYGLASRYERLRAKGLLDAGETAAELGVCTQTVKTWRAMGLLTAYPYNAKNEYLYEPPGDDAPDKFSRKGIAAYRRSRRHTESDPRGAV
jgi:DNA invertase Pin-like site-specific DNA recombinase